MAEKLRYEPYDQPAGGWGSMYSLTKHSTQQQALRAVPALRHQNKPGGYMCVSCAWAKPAKPHLAEFCENGAKATFWELTSKRATPEFFAEHKVGELLTWRDFDLEDSGRLTHPLRYDSESDRYLPVTWEEAFRDIGERLKGYAPDSVIFYASGRASLEASYLYQLFARLYGTNNLPDSSNMCHETTSVALPESIGVPVGTVTLEDFEKTDCIFSFGQNVGTNSPRMLHQLQEASERGARIVTFNPLRETGWEEFVNPQAPGQMISRKATRISSHYFQVRAGGDIAAILGLCKALIEWDDQGARNGGARLLDHEFIAEHTQGFEDFAAFARAQSWDALQDASALSRAELEAAARLYADAKSVVAIYGMGLTQHRLGVDSVQMLVNLLLLRGNIGRAGAGICPVRGHSNVQGQRTVGIAEKPELVPLDRLAELYDFAPPREEGLTTVDACDAIIKGRIKAFIGLGGNYLRAVPERMLMERSWPELELSVQVATKLNRTHLVTAKTSYLLPCLGRIEVDEQASGPQVVTIEDSTACIHASHGVAKPASEHLLSEVRIVAELAKATLPPNPKVPWDEWAGDYGRIRDAIEATYPEDFRDFNARMDRPGGFPRPLPARERRWATESGKANFKVPSGLSASFDLGEAPEVFRLITLRSNDQFNTTIYGYDDRFRGIHDTRMVVMMNPNDVIRFGFSAGESVTLVTVADDGIDRRLSGLTILEYDIPEGCCAAYYPECNGLIPLWQHAEKSKVPAAKSVPVRIQRDGA